jgi:hypothetical protein
MKHKSKQLASVLRTPEDVQLFTAGLLTSIVHHVHAATVAGDQLTLDQANFYMYSLQIAELATDTLLP